MQYESRREVEETSRKQRLLIDDAIANRKVIEGMSTHDVMRAVGYPDSKQSEISGDNRIETWVKGNLIISLLIGVGLENLRLFLSKQCNSTLVV